MIIQVENLSKRYRIGSKEPGYRTFRESIVDTFTAPMRNYRQLRKLTKFNDSPEHTHKRSIQTSPAILPQSTLSEKDIIWALKDISFEVPQGEVVGIIGRNGAGKSTLLKILSRITEPTSGEVSLYGRVSSLLEVGTGFHPELTGRENIYLNGTILGMRRSEINTKFDEIVAFAEIEKFLDTPVKRYSSGMYVRLAFAVAAHLEQEIMIIDEVLAVGDSQFQNKCLRKMEHVAKLGRTILFVSHRMEAILNLCTVGYLLDQGRIVSSGNIDEVVSEYLAKCRSYSKISLSERADRAGSGILRFDAITLQDKTGQEVSVANVGKDLCMQISYSSGYGHPLRNVNFGIAIAGAHGNILIPCGNKAAGFNFDNIPAKGAVMCSIPRLPLMPGSYSLHLYCEVNNEIADTVQDAFMLEVEDGDFYRTGKLPPRHVHGVLVDQSWEIKEL
ncbi:MAG: ABC transporter ATP-binding protein [Deltaproteobacteria bacterium]|nr:ABC transporter ATP-binding protein [Deltaproteobacteria bacterium]